MRDYVTLPDWLEDTDRARRMMMREQVVREHYEEYLDQLHGEGDTLAEAKARVRRWIDSDIEEFVHRVSYLPAHNIEVYRALTVPAKAPVQSVDMQNVGVYWAYNKRGATAHWGNFSKGMRTYTLIGEVEPRYVDWRQSLINHCLFSGEEYELHLYGNSPMHVIAITADSGAGGPRHDFDPPFAAMTYDENDPRNRSRPPVVPPIRRPKKPLSGLRRHLWES